MLASVNIYTYTPPCVYSELPTVLVLITGVFDLGIANAPIFCFNVMCDVTAAVSLRSETYRASPTNIQHQINASALRFGRLYLTISISFISLKNEI